MAAAVAGGAVGASLGGASVAFARRRLGATQGAFKWNGAQALPQRATRGVPRPGCPQHEASRRVVCMAAPKRVAMVGKQIEREIGTMLLRDKVLQEAVCPDRKRGQDSYLTALASVTEVDISRDLQVAKVYISVYSDAEGKERAFAALKKLEGYVRKNIGQRIRLRMTPEIRFIPDDSFDRSQRVLSLLKKIEDGSAEAPGIAIPGDSVPGFDDLDAEWDEEEEDMGLLVADDDDDEEEELLTKGMNEAERRAVSDAAMREFLGGGQSRGYDTDMFSSSNKPSRLPGGRGGKGNNRKRK